MNIKKVIGIFKVHELFGICIAILLPSIAYVISRYSGSAARDYAGILGPTTGLFGVIYGAFWFWPNYLQQKRLDNVLVTTKEALGGLLETEEKVKKILFVLSSKPFDREEQIHAHFDLSYAITRLKNAVMLLKRDEDLVSDGLIEKTLNHIRIFEQLLDNKNTIIACAHGELTSDISDKVNQITELVNKLKSDLLRIYDLS